MIREPIGWRFRTRRRDERPTNWDRPQGRRNGDGWLVRCPCPNHGKGRGDRFPSLSVADGDSDRLLLRCFAGCEFVDILEELSIADW